MATVEAVALRLVERPTATLQIARGDRHARVESGRMERTPSLARPRATRTMLHPERCWLS